MSTLFADTDRDASEMKTVCHGDFWINNMMFSHDKDTGEPDAVKLIDFQVRMKIYESSRLRVLFLSITDDQPFSESNADSPLKNRWEQLERGSQFRLDYIENLFSWVPESFSI